MLFNTILLLNTGQKKKKRISNINVWFFKHSIKGKEDQLLVSRLISIILLTYSRQFAEFNNCTLPYELPMKVKNIYEVTGVRSYALFCVYLIPTSMMLTIGATGADSLLVTLTFHLCGQLSNVAHRVRNIDVDPQIYFPEMRALVERHTELLRWVVVRKKEKKKKS